MGLGQRWHNRRRKQKKAPPATSSSEHELGPLPRTVQEVDGTKDEEKDGREKDAVSLSDVTIC